MDWLLSFLRGRHGGNGYDPESLRGLLWLSGLLAGWTVLSVLLAPVIIRVNEGRWDRHKTRTEAMQLALGAAQLVVLMLAGAGVYQLLLAVYGGWQGGWRDAAVGALIGTVIGGALGIAANGLIRLLPIAEIEGGVDAPSQLSDPSR